MSARWPAGEPGQAAGQGHRLGFLGCFPRSTGQRTSPTRRLAPAVALDWYMEEGRRQEPNTLHGSRSFRPKTPSAWFLWTLPTGKAAPRTGHPTLGTVSRPSDQGHLGPFPWMLPPWSCPGTPWTPPPRQEDDARYRVKEGEENRSMIAAPERHQSGPHRLSAGPARVSPGGGPAHER